MPTADQIKALVRFHYSNDDERFRTTVLQMAAQEAKAGRTAIALELRDILDSERRKHKKIPNPFSNELGELVQISEPSSTLKDLVVSSELRARINRVLVEFRNRDRIKSHGLNHRRKILLTGPPGTGKTLTARVLASTLKLPFYTIQMDRLATKYMGESSAKLRQVFDLIHQELGLYLFDEFDAIGGERSLENDVGEMRRVLNSFLHFVEQDHSDSIIVAATNNPQLLDYALFRRFDDILYYGLPSDDERSQLMKNLAGTYVPVDLQWEKITAESNGLSQAELTQAVNDALKSMILDGNLAITFVQLMSSIKARQLHHEYSFHHFYHSKRD